MNALVSNVLTQVFITLIAVSGCCFAKKLKRL